MNYDYVFFLIRCSDSILSLLFNPTLYLVLGVTLRRISESFVVLSLLDLFGSFGWEIWDVGGVEYWDSWEVGEVYPESEWLVGSGGREACERGA